MIYRCQRGYLEHTITFYIRIINAVLESITFISKSVFHTILVNIIIVSIYIESYIQLYIPQVIFIRNLLSVLLEQV